MKQIVGSTLSDLKEEGQALVTNFESDKSAGEYARMYKEDGLTGGHVIMLGADPLSRAAAIEALRAYPGGSIASCFLVIVDSVALFDFSNQFLDSTDFSKSFSMYLSISRDSGSCWIVLLGSGCYLVQCKNT